MSRKYKFRNPEGFYFITFATVGWIDVFTRNIYRDILIDSFKYCIDHKGLVIHAYVIMTNHIHMIVSSKEGLSVSDIIRDLKKYTSMQLLDTIRSNQSESRREWMLRVFSDAGRHNSNNMNFQFWQQHNHPIELFGNAIFEQKLLYIHDNPVRVGFVSKAEDYVYSSARNNCEEQGILEITLLS